MTCGSRRRKSSGPVISAIPFTDIEEVIERGNKTQFGLGGGVETDRAICGQGASSLGEGHSRRLGVDQLLSGNGPGGAVRGLQDEWLRPRGPGVQHLEEYLNVKSGVDQDRLTALWSMRRAQRLRGTASSAPLTIFGHCAATRRGGHATLVLAPRAPGVSTACKPNQSSQRPSRAFSASWGLISIASSSNACGDRVVLHRREAEHGHRRRMCDAIALDPRGGLLSEESEFSHGDAVSGQAARATGQGVAKGNQGTQWHSPRSWCRHDERPWPTCAGSGARCPAWNFAPVSTPTMPRIFNRRSMSSWSARSCRS